MEFNNLLPGHNLFGSNFRCFFKNGCRLTQKEATRLFFAGEEIYDQSSSQNKRYNKENVYHRRLLLTESRDTTTESEMIEIAVDGIMYRWYTNSCVEPTFKEIIRKTE